jgi:hypothetical protein
MMMMMFVRLRPRTTRSWLSYNIFIITYIFFLFNKYFIFVDFYYVDYFYK